MIDEQKQRWLSTLLGPTGHLVSLALASIESASTGVLDDIGARFRGWWGPETDIGRFRLSSIDAVDTALEAERRSHFTRHAAVLAEFVAYRDGVRFGAVPASEDACRAVSASDLVGQHGLEQVHIDFLVEPFVQAFGQEWPKS